MRILLLEASPLNLLSIVAKSPALRLSEGLLPSAKWIRSPLRGELKSIHLRLSGKSAGISGYRLTLPIH